MRGLFLLVIALTVTVVSVEMSYQPAEVQAAPHEPVIVPYLNVDIREVSKREEIEPVYTQEPEVFGAVLTCTGEIEPELEYLGEWTTTAYCACEICCGEWATGCTASGVPATANHTVACGILPFGTELVIDGQTYVVEDTGVTGEWIDIYFDSHEEALNYGMQTKSIYRVNNGISD